MNWQLVIAGIVALLGVSAVPVAEVVAPRIQWLGDDVPGAVMTPTIAPGTRQSGPLRKLNDSLGVDVTARSVFIMDAETGTALYEKNPDQVRAIASITKLMSLMVAIDNIDRYDAFVDVQKDDLVPYGTTTLSVGDRIAVSDLIAAAVIASDNSAITALARHTGLNREAFVAAMNAKAKDLGLSQTIFVDVTGLADGNRSTAREILVFAAQAFAYPSVVDYAARRTHQYRTESGHERTIRTTNRLIGSFISVVHGKTGFVTESGYNLVAEVSDDGQRRLLGVVLGSATNDDRFQDFKMAAFWVWQNFTWPAEV